MYLWFLNCCEVKFHVMLKKIKRLNALITKRVIELQANGYLYDFKSTEDGQFLCLQDSNNFSIPDISIRLIDQVYDQFSQTYKYIHTVETASGHKGLLLEEAIYIR